MADDRRSYPAVPTSTWFTIRKRFIASPPRGELTAEYFSDLLNISKESARVNVVTPFKQMGLIGPDNKLSERGWDWRDDERYSEICEAIRQEVYPTSLLDLAPDTSTDPSVVTRWFTRQGLGEGRAKTLTAFYMLLLEADPNKAQETQTKSSRVTKGTTSRATKSKKQTTPRASTDSSVNENIPDSQPSATLTRQEPIVSKFPQPSLHFDIQIHISPESTPEQIDQIFASMAKHLKELQ